MSTYNEPLQNISHTYMKNGVPTGTQCVSSDRGKQWTPYPEGTSMSTALSQCAADPKCYAVRNKYGIVSWVDTDPYCTPGTPNPDEVYVKNHAPARCAFSTWNGAFGPSSSCGNKTDLDKSVQTYCKYVDPNDVGCRCVNMDPLLAANNPQCASQNHYMTDAANAMLNPYYVTRNWIIQNYLVLLLIFVIIVIALIVYKRYIPSKGRTETS